MQMGHGPYQLTQTDAAALGHCEWAEAPEDAGTFGITERVLAKCEWRPSICRTRCKSANGSRASTTLPVAYLKQAENFLDYGPDDCDRLRT